MDKYVDSLTEAIHRVFKGVVCNHCYYAHHYAASYHGESYDELICTCSDQEHPIVTSMDMTTAIWLQDNSISWQKMFAVGMPYYYADASIIVISEFRRTFDVDSYTEEQFLGICNGLVNLYTSTELPIMMFINTFKKALLKPHKTPLDAVKAAEQAVHRRNEKYRLESSNESTAFKCDVEAMQWLSRIK